MVKWNAEFHTTNCKPLIILVRISKRWVVKEVFYEVVCLFFLFCFLKSPSAVALLIYIFHTCIQVAISAVPLLTSVCSKLAWQRSYRAGGKSTVCKQLCLSVFHKLRMPFPVQKGSTIAPRLVHSLRGLNAWVRRPFCAELAWSSEMWILHQAKPPSSHLSKDSLVCWSGNFKLPRDSSIHWVITVLLSGFASAGNQASAALWRLMRCRRIETQKQWYIEFVSDSFYGAAKFCWSVTCGMQSDCAIAVGNSHSYCLLHIKPVSEQFSYSII